MINLFYLSITEYLLIYTYIYLLDINSGYLFKNIIALFTKMY